MTRGELLAAEPREPGHRAAMLCVPHAGAGASSLFDFRDAAPDWLHTGVVRFAGRESRFHDALPARADDYVAEVVMAAAALAPDVPLALMGHCSGVVLALAALPALADLGVRASALVAVSAPPPTAPPVSVDARMTDEELLAELASGGQVADRLLCDPDMMDLLLPQIRADFVALATVPRPLPVPGFPICFVRGDGDPLLDERQTARWQAWSGRTTSVTVAGAHFLATDPSFELWDVVDDFLVTALAPS